jgi:hypothetical protein
MGHGPAPEEAGEGGREGKRRGAMVMALVGSCWAAKRKPTWEGEETRVLRTRRRVLRVCH